MMQAFRKIYTLVLTIFLSSITYSTDYYVDNAASGGNNGTSWTNAWQSFSAINWGSIQPGDYLYVSGGSDSTIYYEDMVVGTSGTSGNQITIIAGKYAPSPSGHSGRVIIDGENHSRLYAIHLDYRSYITIKGFEVRDHERGIAIRHDAVGCIIDSNRVTNFTEQGGIRIDGSGSTCNPADWTSSDHIIKNNIVISPEDVPTQCDGIYIQRCQDILIHNNYVHNRNRSVVNSHTDGIQTHCVMNLKFTNNVVIADSNAIGMPMVIRAESDGVGDADSVIFYNNLFYGGGLWFDGAPWVNCIDHQSDWGPSGVEPYTIMIHNTIISHGPFYAPVWKERHSETEKHLMINNIVAQFGDGVTGVPSQYHGIFRNSAGAWVVDNTLGGFYYCEWGDFDPMNTVTGNGNTGGCSSWSEWVNTYGGTGIFSNPLFVSPIGYIEDEGIITGELQLNSPAINAGVDIQAIVEGMGLPWADINGNPRDNTPTIGAWEYDAGPDLTPPTVTGASLLDSVTLEVSFSETLDQTTAEDENNYSITNNINVFIASLSGSKVTLQTSVHSPGSYVVTVNNIEDLAGNPIAQSNTAEYEYIVIPPDSLMMFPVENVEGIIVEPDHTPEKTIDGLGALSGDPDSRWAAEPMPEELIFDLGSIRTVCKTKLSFYRWNYGRVYTYSILISSDNNNWVTIVPQATSASNEEWTIDEFPPVNARYVQVHFINNNQSEWAGLWEGEIWGIDSSTLIDPVNNSLPNEYSLYQNYPNPFNPSTTISYSIPASSFITIKVYDVLGNEVVRLVNKEKPEGSYDVKFDATGLPSGIYFYRLQAGSFIETKKMILMK